MSAPHPSIHVVSASNASLLDRVDDGVFDNPVEPALLRAFLANPANLLIVAVVERKVVGMATAICHVHPDKPVAMFINEVGVSPRVRGQGIGTRLVSALLNEARGRGCSEAWVATEFGNAPARALYESLGGQPDAEHAVVYHYPLGSAGRKPAGGA